MKNLLHTLSILMFALLFGAVSAALIDGVPMQFVKKMGGFSMPWASAEQTRKVRRGPSSPEDLKRLRADLDKKQEELKKREEEIAAKERALNEEIGKLEGMRKDLMKLSDQKEEAANERVAKLVETVEKMSPKAASKLIEDLDEQLAVSTMKQMSSDRLAKVMNTLEPAKASRLSELMAGVVRAPERNRSVSRDTAAATKK